MDRLQTVLSRAIVMHAVLLLTLSIQQEEANKDQEDFTFTSVFAKILSGKVTRAGQARITELLLWLDFPVTL